MDTILHKIYARSHERSDCRSLDHTGIKYMFRKNKEKLEKIEK